VVGIAAVPTYFERPRGGSRLGGVVGQGVGVTARPLRELVDDGWATALQPVEDQVAKMGQFLREEIAAGRGYLPAGENVLRAFTFPFDKVRVLIVGQDPYPTPGHAVGLSFSVAADVRPLPRSLENIFSEYGRDLGFPAPSCGDLTPWAQRGVMMLNRVLTVQPRNAASHRGKGWEAVTECAIRALVDRRQPLVAILWGRDAATLKPMLAGGDCVAIESPHPSPLSASRGFFGSRPFSRANELLAQMGAEPIDWQLP
jgi:uracil-DNA glycosylase